MQGLRPCILSIQEDTIMATLNIEHHAVLFALLSREAILRCGEAGKAAILKGMTRYGNERGRRMAANALAHGEELTVLNSQAYGEWKPDFPGQVVSGVTEGEPELHTFISRCAWCDAWEKHGLMEYGKYYCCDIDNAWFQGFNPAFTCTQLNPPMSWGGDCCRFAWGEALSKEQLAELAEKKQRLGASCMRDFNFHTAHLLYAISDTLISELGEEGRAAVEAATAAFDEKFGPEPLRAIEGIYP